MSGAAEGALTERAAVVAWLRACASTWASGGHPERAAQYTIAAEEIECGVHRTGDHAWGKGSEKP